MKNMMLVSDLIHIHYNTIDLISTPDLLCSDKTSQIHTNPAYNDCCKNFMNRSKNRKSGLRVLALFDGKGSLAVVL